MFSRLREPFGKAGLIVAIVALVAALAGGAYAAGSGSLLASSSGKDFKKAKAGPRGPRGKTGPAGPAGPQGPTGASGKDGANGSPGEKGEKGDKGENGKNGKDGKDGSPWPGGGTLAPEATETGSWAFGPVVAPPCCYHEPVRIPLSFNVQLPASLDASHVHFINAQNKEVTEVILNFNTNEAEVIEVTSNDCLGEVTAPSANPGNLCVYSAAMLFTGFGVQQFENGEIYDPSSSGFFTEGASIAGAELAVKGVNESAKGWGTWAVTAP